MSFASEPDPHSGSPIGVKVDATGARRPGPMVLEGYYSPLRTFACVQARSLSPRTGIAISCLESARAVLDDRLPVFSLGHISRDDAADDIWRRRPRPERECVSCLPLVDRSCVHGAIIFWCKTAFPIEEFARRHLSDLRKSAEEIVNSLHAALARQSAH